MIRTSAAASDGWLEAALQQVRADLEQRLAALASLTLMAPTGGASGKLLRPRLLLTVAAPEDLRLPVSEQIVSLAAAVELIHLATLHHDDVLDDSPHRRRAQSARQLFGNKVSILFGDALLAAALDALLRCSDRRMQAAVARAVTATLRGEIAQHTGHRTLELAEVECVRVASLKTGSLFGLAAQLGSLATGRGRETALVAYRVGRRLGTAFQLIDDALDFAATAELLGKEPGSDYRQGIATLPLACAWRASGEAERRVLAAGFGADGNGDFATVREIVLRPDHFEPTLAAVERQLARARALVPALALPDCGGLIAAYFQEIEERIPHPIHAHPVSAPDS